MSRFVMFLFAGTLLAAGCNEAKPTPKAAGTSTPVASASTPKADPDKLSPEDEALVKLQKRCPITDDELGSMGTPAKIMIKGQPVFLCCAGCEKEALKDPDKTLKKVEELKKGDAKTDKK